MAITDLTGTTWTIPAGWTSLSYDSELGFFTTYYLSGSITYNGTTYEGLAYFRASNKEYLYFMFENEALYIQNTYDITFTITGGADATAIELIEWLEADGKLTKTLKGVWRLRETLAFAKTVKASISFDILGGETDMTQIFFEVYDTGTLHVTYQKKWDDGGTTSSQYYDSANGWYSETSRYVLFRAETEVPAPFFYAFIGNADEITNDVTAIYYGDDIIAALFGGRTVKLSCGGMVMDGDIIVTVPESPAEYDGTIIIEDALTLSGFTGLTNASGELTHTDSIAEVAAYSTATSGTAVTVSNDLDNYFPYNQITEFTDADGNVFVKFPKMYIKWVLDADGNIDGWQVSDKEFEGSFIPDCYLNSDGVSYNDYFAISKYSMSGTKDKGYSVSGQAPLVSITRAEARAAARAYGTADNYYGGYQIMDMSMVTVYNFLCMMYYRTSNIQSVFKGRVEHDNAIATGGTDAISGMNGWDTETGATKMLGVENYYCNVGHWIDGVTFVNGLAYLPRLPQNYSDTSDNCVVSEVVLPVATSAPYWSKHLQAGTTAGTQSYVFQSDYAAEYDGTDVWENQYSCDPFVYVNAGDTPFVLCGGGYWVDVSLAGLWFLGAGDVASGSYSVFGARLSYRPL